VQQFVERVKVCDAAGERETVATVGDGSSNIVGNLCIPVRSRAGL
jgi:hypothetical protein